MPAEEANVNNNGASASFFSSLQQQQQQPVLKPCAKFFSIQ